MSKQTGLGARLVELLKRNGYESTRSKYGVDVARFTNEHGYVITMFFKWLGDQTRPSDEHVLQLARDLGASPGDILFGTANQAPRAPRRLVQRARRRV